MDDLLAVEPTEDTRLTVEHVRVLKMVRRGAGRPTALPLRFKQDNSVVERLIADGLVIAGPSGWPGVPGYMITPDGVAALSQWLSKQRTFF